MKEYRCWQCGAVVPDEQQEYNLQFGQWGNWEQLAYLCSKECLAQWLSDHWNEME